MRQALSWLSSARARMAVGGLALALHGCGGGDAERAAQAARIDSLEQTVNRLSEQLKYGTQPKSTAQHGSASAASSFKLACPQPWLQHAPLGASLWSCRAPAAAPEGLYPMCSVVFLPQHEIETKGYFEYSLNATPQLREIKGLKDQRTKIKTNDAFESTFEADLKPVPLKMQSALIPRGEMSFVVTCFAPSGSFDAYAKAFRQIIDSFEFR
jgi:hypothetical protein